MKTSKKWLKKVLAPIVEELQKHTAFSVYKGSGVASSTIDTIKSGKNINPRIQTLAAIVAYFESLDKSEVKK